MRALLTGVTTVVWLVGSATKPEPGDTAQVLPQERPQIAGWKPIAAIASEVPQSRFGAELLVGPRLFHGLLGCLGWAMCCWGHSERDRSANGVRDPRRRAIRTFCAAVGAISSFAIFAGFLAFLRLSVLLKANRKERKEKRKGRKRQPGLLYDYQVHAFPAFCGQYSENNPRPTASWSEGRSATKTPAVARVCVLRGLPSTKPQCTMAGAGNTRRSFPRGMGACC
jgi:hypothetical protein